MTNTEPDIYILREPVVIIAVKREIWDDEDYFFVKFNLPGYPDGLLIDRETFDRLFVRADTASEEVQPP